MRLKSCVYVGGLSLNLSRHLSLAGWLGGLVCPLGGKAAGAVIHMYLFLLYGVRPGDFWRSPLRCIR